MNRLNNLTRVIPKPFFGNIRISYPLCSKSFGQASLSKGIRFYSSAHENESFEEFSDRYIKFFEGVDDRFELQRGLNNCFAYDLVPSPEVIQASLKAARRINDYSIAVRVFEGLKQKLASEESKYNEYLDELKPIKEELGVLTKEELGL
ncbi:2805_t:CDS:2 [Entrophospora sp. SA101]|nr:4191_t:CDS:2 [Entrophospora sp. SA101]CAJ0630959.1 2805_t:CDS:2 [Entrophospora sp. SA101]CAJ0858645.1 4174_t:CDS:2 [Entrophospora sp. SA101]CAJ0867680.1 4648_t:CDS:2 [Entrophospora sp. SA101]